MTKVCKHLFGIISIRRNKRKDQTTLGSTFSIGNVSYWWFSTGFNGSKWIWKSFLLILVDFCTKSEKKMKNLFDFERSKKWLENHSRTWPWYENICLGSYLSKQLKNKLTCRLVRVLMSETWVIDDFLPFTRIQSDFERIWWIK